MPTNAFELASREGRQPTWEMAFAFPDQGTWSESEYLQLDLGRHVEFTKGCLELQPMPDSKHQAIVLFFGSHLRDFGKVSGGRAKIAPFPVRLWEEKYREPDACYMREVNLDRCHEEFWEGADLAIEVLSVSNRDHDLIRKRREYAQAGIGEYWIVDPIERTIRILVLAGSEYAENAVAREGERVASPSLPGLELAVTDVFNAP